MKKDNVNSPSHYNQGNRETIESIRLMLGDEGMKAYCKGNIFKYMSRAHYKHETPDEDLAKKEWYENYLEKLTNKEI